MSKIYGLTLQRPAAYTSNRIVCTMTAIFAHVGAWRDRDQQGTGMPVLRQYSAGTSTAEIALRTYLRAEFPKEYANSVPVPGPACDPVQCL